MLHRARYNALLLCSAAAIGLAAISGEASAAEKRAFEIEAQPLATALMAFGNQSGVAVVAPGGLTLSKTTSSVSATVEPETALRMMLAGTGLTYRREGDLFAVVQEGEGGSPQGDSAAGGGASTVEALIVTAQKKEEAIQDVPIAISAFTQKTLDEQKLEGGFDLLKAIPNVTFSKTNFTGYNFSIRGIGTKAISVSTDPGVAVAFNNSGLIVNRLFEQEYFDVERVEVLRGPQGTLYGRNATSGVINVISAKPRLGEFEADAKVETGNYNAFRMRGMVNVPLGDTIAVRGAFASTKRDGYGLNLLDGSDVDDRDLFSTRLTVAFEPSERLRINALWEHFEEDDGRVRTSKQLCHHDPGPTEILGVPIPNDFATGGADVQPNFSQGCLPGSLYDEGAFGTPRGNSFPFVFITGLTAGKGDLYANSTQSHDLRQIETTIEPKYRAKADIFDLTVDFDLTDSLTLTSQTLYTQDEVYSTQDLNRFKAAPIFVDSLTNPEGVGLFAAQNPDIYAAISPGGLYCDPQLGCADRMVGQDLSQAYSTQFNQEFRIASNFDGPWNFSFGSNYTYFETLNDYYVFINLLTYIADTIVNVNAPFVSDCPNSGKGCLYVDPNPLDSIDGEGHNYFRSKNPYRLTSSAVFGELYWQATPTFKVTAGVRMTWDRKDFTPVPSQTLLTDYREAAVPAGVVDGQPETCNVAGGGILCNLKGTGRGGRGYPAEADIVQEWAEPTGRLIVDWKPDLAFTDDSMFYASYSRGYKGGGANPPGIAAPARLFVERGYEAAAPLTFEPEFVDAYEIGAKNTLLEGALILNLGAFHYDYKDYQVSKIVDRTAVNENFDAKIWGLEVEWIFSPTRNLRFNGTLGHLNTEIADGEQSIDLMDRTQGDPNLVVIKPSFVYPSNCVAPADMMADFLAFMNLTGFRTAPAEFFCAGGGMAGFLPGSIQVPGTGKVFDPSTVPNNGAGHFADLSGNELPNAPHWTASLGAQYRMELPGGWDATLRGDFYWQDKSYARVYNTEYDRLRAWTNTNISLWFDKPEWDLTAEIYVKNAFDETPITDAFLFSDDTGLVTNVFTLDPRLIGVSVRKNF